MVRPSQDGVRKAHHAELGDQTEHVPVMRVGLPVERDVVHPHVEIGPVNADEKHQAAQRRIPSSPRQNQADTDGNFHHACDEHPDGWIAEDRRNDGFEPSGVREMLNADIDVHHSENDRA